MASSSRRNNPADDNAPRRSVIVTFKAKDKRADTSTDKLEILTQAISSPMQFLDAADMIATAGVEGLQRVASAVGEPEEIGFDVNLYEAPIVSLSLTEDEIKSLKSNPNIAAVPWKTTASAMPCRLRPWCSRISPV